MKLFIASTLVLLLAIQITAEESPKPLWYPQDPYKYAGNMLGFIGAGTIIQQGLFENPNAPLPFFQYSYYSVDKLERKVTDTHTYYRFHTTILQYSGHNGATATYTMKFRHSDSDFEINCPHYNVTELPYYYDQPSGIMIDLRGLNDGTSEFSALLEKALELTVTNAIKNGQLADSKYEFRSAHYAYYNFESSANSAYYNVENAKVFEFNIKIRNSEGRNFIYYMGVHADENERIYLAESSITILQLGANRRIQESGIRFDVLYL